MAATTRRNTAYVSELESYGFSHEEATKEAKKSWLGQVAVFGDAVESLWLNIVAVFIRPLVLLIVRLFEELEKANCTPQNALESTESDDRKST